MNNTFLVFLVFLSSFTFLLLSILFLIISISSSSSFFLTLLNAKYIKYMTWNIVCIFKLHTTTGGVYVCLWCLITFSFSVAALAFESLLSFFSLSLSFLFLLSPLSTPLVRLCCSKNYCYYKYFCNHTTYHFLCFHCFLVSQEGKCVGMCECIYKKKYIDINKHMNINIPT